MREIGYDCLKSVDNSGSLRYYAYNDLEEDLKSEISGCIPPILKYDIEICSGPDCVLDTPDVTVTSVGYIVSGYESYSPRVIELWMWSE